MKKLLFLLFILLVSLKVFCQTSPKSTTFPPDSTKRDTVYMIVLTREELTQLFSLLRTSGRYSSLEIETLIEGLRQRTQEVSTKARTTK